MGRQSVTGGSARRVVGQARWRSPRLHLPHMSHWAADWRRAVAVALALSLLTAGGWWLYSSPLLSIQDVAVEGNVAVSTELARSVAGLEEQSMLRPDFAGARERLLALPLVKDVQIGRDWPNGVRITIEERTAWGLWQAGPYRYVIDGEGFVLDTPAPPNASLVVQTDAVATSLVAGDRVDVGAVAVARQLVSTAGQTLGRSVVALEFSRESGLTAALADDQGGPILQVVFGDAQGYEFKLAALFAVLQQAREEGRTLTRVDLRFGDRAAVQ